MLFNITHFSVCKFVYEESSETFLQIVLSMPNLDILICA